MNFVKDEYKALAIEYSNFVEMIEIHPSTVEIITKEKGELNIRLTTQGWTVLSSSIENIEKDSIFETSEALLMYASPQFARLFNDKLTEKLTKLQESLNQVDS